MLGWVLISLVSVSHGSLEAGSSSSLSRAAGCTTVALAVLTLLESYFVDIWPYHYTPRYKTPRLHPRLYDYIFEPVSIANRTTWHCSNARIPAFMGARQQ